MVLEFSVDPSQLEAVLGDAVKRSEVLVSISSSAFITSARVHPRSIDAIAGVLFNSYLNKSKEAWVKVNHTCNTLRGEK